MSSPTTSSKPAPVWTFRGMLKRLLVIFAVLACLMFVPRLEQTQEVVSQLSGNFDASSLQDWIPRSSHFFKATQTSMKERIVHPIPKLMAEAQTKFKKMITGQSKTLAEAVKEYKRRYGRNPPKGFDEWFEFARANEVKIIDEYDQLVRDLEPFWGMSGEELRRRAVQVRGSVLHLRWQAHSVSALQVGHLPSIDLVRIENGKAISMNIQNGFNDTEVGARAKGFCAMVEKFQHKVRVNAHVRIVRTNVNYSYRIWISLLTLKQKGGSSFPGNILGTQTPHCKTHLQA
jgi:hypothetical protein